MNIFSAPLSLVPDPKKTLSAFNDSAKDYNHRFVDVLHYLQQSGWNERIKGSHHIFTRPGVPVLLNLQPENNGKAKAYQVRQIRLVLSRLK